GLPPATSEVQLMEVFAVFGEVTQVKLLIDKESGQSLGFAYIWFVKEESAQLAAKEMNGKVCAEL
ncbi:RNA-binding protein, partial [Trifolium pratense]